MGSLPRTGVIVVDGRWVVPIALTLVLMTLLVVYGLASAIKKAKETKEIERRKEENERKKH